MIKNVANDIIDALDEESLKIRSESFKIGLNGHRIFSNQFNYGNTDENKFELKESNKNQADLKKNCCMWIIKRVWKSFMIFLSKYLSQIFLNLNNKFRIY